MNVASGALTRAIVDCVDSPSKLRILNATWKAMRLAEQQLAREYRWDWLREYRKRLNEAQFNVQ